MEVFYSYVFGFVSGCQVFLIKIFYMPLFFNIRPKMYNKL